VIRRGIGQPVYDGIELAALIAAFDAVVRANEFQRFSPRQYFVFYCRLSEMAAPACSNGSPAKK
jgi:hypothetical protein